MSALEVQVEPLPGLAVHVLAAVLPVPLGEVLADPRVGALLAADAPAPLAPDETLRRAVRDVLRQRGYRPTGRGKPSSEYLQSRAAAGPLEPINPAVDAANAVSLHSGLPISLIDSGRAVPPLRIAVAAAGARYVFNASGQEIDVAGLPCLFDAAGPCANAVKDAQRTKTDARTRRLLAVVWGCETPDPGRPAAAAAWLGRLLGGLGAEAAAVAITQAG